MVLLRLFASPETKFWVSTILLLIVALGYLSSIATKGLTSGYLKTRINDNLKNALVVIHGLGPLLIALILPNNYLNEIDFFQELYESNQLWIPISIVMLLLIFIILFGTVFTLLTRRWQKS
jgi:hypothetical protein